MKKKYLNKLDISIIVIVFLTISFVTLMFLTYNICLK